MRTVGAVLAGLVAGAALNLALVSFGPLAAAPAGIDPAAPPGLEAMVAAMQPRHFVLPWLAHALGTLAGAALAARLAPAARQAAVAWSVGALFLLGGVINALMLPLPGGFVALDLGLAYLPMAWLGLRLGRRATR